MRREPTRRECWNAALHATAILIWSQAAVWNIVLDHDYFAAFCVGVTGMLGVWAVLKN